jgi:large subunit ribosomal protein L4
MKKVELLNLKGEKVKDINLNEEIFGITPNKAVLTDAVILSMASLRQGTHKTKNRSEVSGGGRKPWRQKGTGRARQGSLSANQWRKGGIAGGVQPRDYTFDMNRKERQLAIKSALSHKYQDKELIVIDKIELENLKTKNVKEIIKDLKLDGKVLFVTKDENENLFMASRNLGYAYAIMADEINCYDIVNANKLVCDEEAVKVIEGGLK